MNRWNSWRIEMALMTKEEYIASLRKLKPVAYMFGERFTDIVDNPRLRPGIEATAATYELAQMAEHRDLIVTESPLIGEPVNHAAKVEKHNKVAGVAALTTAACLPK